MFSLKVFQVLHIVVVCFSQYDRFVIARQLDEAGPINPKGDIEARPIEHTRFTATNAYTRKAVSDIADSISKGTRASEGILGNVGANGPQGSISKGTPGLCFGSNSCPNGGKCIGTNSCSCLKGFAAPMCKDINECRINNGGCEHLCSNIHGSFLCSCFKGYKLHHDMRSCNALCHMSTTCPNKGFCSRPDTCICMKGFARPYCTDIDECREPMKGECSHLCINTHGSYRCSCNKGYVLQSDGKTCVVFCHGSATCPNGGTCKSPDYCMCPKGYASPRCTDIDECKLKNGGCSQGCHNTHGSYNCFCNKGYVLQRNGRTCEDINECLVNNGGCDQNCTNYPGGFECNCKAGFSLADDKKTCHDIDECSFFNGGCQDLCVNTIGSFHCTCEGGRNLDSAGKVCRGNETGETVFDKYKIPKPYLPRGCAYIELFSCDRSTKLLLSSTSDWYRLKTNSSILYTNGIVFAEVNQFYLPMSISGMVVVSTGINFKIMTGVPTYTEQDGTALTNKHTDNCLSFDLTPKDVYDFITSGSFLATFLKNFYDKLPDWLRFSENGVSLLAINDLKTDLVYGRDMNSLRECRDAPVRPRNLYNVFRFGTNFSISIYGNQKNIPAPLRENKFCIITDICQNRGGTVFLIIPPESRNLLDNFNFFETLATQYGLRFRPRGIGLSINKGIDVRYKSNVISVWNGDGFTQIPIFPTASVWMNTGIEMDYEPSDSIGLSVAGQTELYLALPNVSTLLTGLFVEEMNGVMNFERFSVTPTLNFTLLEKDVSLTFTDLAVASMENYLSLGGSEDRVWCGDGANPAGVFVSFNMNINPFRQVPILKDWLFNFNVRIYAFLASEPYQEPEMNLLSDIFDIQKFVDKFLNIVENFITDLGQELDEFSRSLLNKLREITKQLQEKLKELEKNPHLLQETIEFISDIWKIYAREIQTIVRDLIGSLEYHTNTLVKNISTLIDETQRDIGQSIDETINSMRNQSLFVIKNNTGFGMRLKVSTMKLGGLEFSLLDLEFVYTIDQLGQCSKFRKVYSFLDGEKSAKVLARTTITQRLGYFMSAEVSTFISVAFSISGDKFVAHWHCHIKFFGIRISTDVLLSNKELYFLIEVHIWNVYLAQVEFTAKIKPKWYDLEYIAKGKFVARSVGSKSDFNGSYLDGLRIISKQIAEKADKRLKDAQKKVTAAQKALDKIKDKLTSAQKKVKDANKAFDDAIKALDKAKEKLEQAKGPFEEALEKLKKAQKDVDKLCKIKTCSKICVPGLKLKICKKGWFKYPCLKKTDCLFKIPNVICEAKNVACRAIRGLAYLALEAAKIFVKAPMLAFDAAKALLSGAQIIVDKSRIVLDLAIGVLELAKLAVDAGKGVLEVAKGALQLLRFALKAAFYIMQLIIRYGLQSLIDVKNCRFEVAFKKSDKSQFEVACDVQAFRLGWKTFKFEFDFKRPLKSMLKMAKATVKSLLSIIKSILNRRKRRSVSFDTFLTLENKDQESPNILEDIIDETNQIKLENLEQDRPKYFKENCLVFRNIYQFLYSTVEELVSITNDSVPAIQDVNSIKEMLSDMKRNMTTENMSLEQLEISSEYALKDYKISKGELENEVKKLNIGTNPVISEIKTSTDLAGDMLEDQLKEAENVSPIAFWLDGVHNYTRLYFKESECIGYEDCVFYSLDNLHEIFSDDDVTNSAESREIIRKLELNFQNLLDDKPRPILAYHRLSTYIITILKQLEQSNVFCSELPKIISSFRNQTVKPGCSFSFSCKATGNPTPEISWYHNDSVIAGAKDSVLKVQNASINDGGVYKCVAQNIVGNVSSSAAYVLIQDQKPVCQGLWMYFATFFSCSPSKPCLWGVQHPSPCTGNLIIYPGIQQGGALKKIK